MNKNAIMLLCGALFAIPAALPAAVPQLKGSQETAGTTGLKVKPPTGAQMVQAVTPKGQKWTFRRGTEKWSETHYDAREIWYGHECGAVWKDRKGNQLTLATPSAFCPSFEKGHAKREDIMSSMAGDADAFKELDDETLARAGPRSSRRLRGHGTMRSSSSRGRRRASHGRAWHSATLPPTSSSSGASVPLPAATSRQRQSDMLQLRTCGRRQDMVSSFHDMLGKANSALWGDGRAHALPCGLFGAVAQWPKGESNE